MAHAIASIMFDSRMDIRLLSRLIAAELESFKREYGRHQITERQTLRASLIAWLARVLPEIFSKSFTKILAETVQQFWDRDDFATNGWYRGLPLEAALYCLTHERKWLAVHLGNLDHHKSCLRDPLIDSLAVVADGLDSHDVELREGTHHNLLVGHAASGCIAIIMAAGGESEEKKQLFRRWLRDEQQLFNCDLQYLKDVVEDKFVPNPFLHRMLRVNQYLAFRLGSLPIEAKQLRLPFLSSLDDRARTTKELCTSCCQLGEVWDRVTGHPFSTTHLSLQLMDSGRNAACGDS